MPKPAPDGTVSAPELPFAGARAATLAQAAALDRAHLRHSRFVGLMKLLLPALAIAIVALILAWPEGKGARKRFRVDFAAGPSQEAESLRMVRPRFTGVDGEGRPFTVTAEVATRIAPQSDLVGLERPEADITLTRGAWVALKASEGTYNQATQELELRRQVDLFHDAGYEFHTTKALLGLKDGTARGDEPVEGQGPFGRLTAQGFRILDRGDIVIFTGRSTLVLQKGAGRAGP
jgi:lipopolysaccharide export system protein LptC